MSIPSLILHIHIWITWSLKALWGPITPAWVRTVPLIEFLLWWMTSHHLLLSSVWINIRWWCRGHKENTPGIFPAGIQTAVHLTDRLQLYLQTVINRPGTPPHSAKGNKEKIIKHSTAGEKKKKKSSPHFNKLITKVYLKCIKVESILRKSCRIMLRIIRRKAFSFVFVLIPRQDRETWAPQALTDLRKFRGSKIPGCMNLWS